jgi:uncharacterized repeat protein (TIGR01451 family)
MKSFLSSLRQIDDSLSILSDRKIKNFVVLVLLCSGSIGALQLITTRPSQAEGSKEMTSDVSGYRPWFNSPSAGALYQGITQQLVANVYAEAGEIINVGSSGIGLNGATIILKSPNGTIYTATGSGGLGLINNRAQEVAGPLPNSGGYTPYSRTVLAAETGVWQVTFISPGISSIGALPNTTAWTRSGNQGDGITANGALVAWDATVRNSGGTSIPGRAYITNLGGDMGSFYPSILKTNFYVLTKDGYVYQMNTNTLAPLVFNFFSNNKGFTSAGNPTYKSLNGVPTVGTNVSDPNATDSGTNITNKIFLNNPLLASLPTSASHPVAGSTWLMDIPINPSISSFTYTRNVSASGGTFNFTANTAGSYSIEIDTNNNGSYTDAVDRNIQGLTLSGSNSYVWDGKDGAGKIVNNKNTLTARIATRSGEVHFPVTDAESNPNGFIITRINGIGTGDSTIYWDDTSISATIGTKNLAGATSSPSGAHIWGSNSTDQATQSGAFGNNVGIDTWTFIRSASAFTSVFPAPSLGTCPATPYISQGINNTSIKLNSVDLQSGVLTPISASNFAAGVNAIGFNQLDGYIYGMKAGSNNTVMKIDANGVGYDLGAITGLPLADYIAGDVDANGILYVKSLVGTSAYGIDVNSASPTYLTLVKTITGLATISGTVPGVQDFAFHPSNGKLYTIQGATGNVYEISWPAAGASVAATLVNRGKPTNLPIGTYGAVYFASDGSMYGYSNGTVGSNNGAIYRMTNVVGTGLPVATTLTTTAAGVSFNDGARCPLAPPVLALNNADYGDAPATYDSGTPASHQVPAAPTAYLGTLPPDKELAPSTPLDGSGDNSTGTNDEDGVTFVGGTTLNTGATASVSVATNGTGTLYAWIDFNGNGIFESSERITNWATGNPSTGGTTTLTFGVPEGFTGTTYARFRYSSDVAAANPTGSANDGEVEDYQITLAPRLTPATYGNGTPVRKGICSIYSATGADQVVTAPTGAKGLTIKLWGAGGGHEIAGTGYAGAGGYTDAQFGSAVVTPGAQFTLVVGRGGMFGGRPDEFIPTAVYGFGAVAGHEQGGGLAGLFTGGTAVLETDRARTLAIAGGGGGYEHSGGIGTGTTGGNGNSPSSGGQSTMRGSTDNLTRTSNSNVIMTAHISSGGGGYQGGGRLPAPNPYSAVTGGDLANIAAASGGSGFVAGTATAGRILSTTDGIGTPPNTSDSDYLTGIGTAGTLGTNAGGNARAVLCWDVSDYGDAPASYDVGTPASHLLSSSPFVYLGAIAPDGESAPQPSVAADGDNTNGTSDEDAFTTLPNVLTTGSYSLNNIPVKNTSLTAATLNAWIDFNKDGVFQASEYTSVSIPANATTANLNWASIPAGTTAGSTYARFRITTDALSDNAGTPTVDERSIGTASDGEVEDYAVTIVTAAKANLILVKRITAIKDGVTSAVTNYSGSVADLNLSDLANYSNCNWPTATGTAGACTNTFLAGATTTTAPKVKPGDEIEYTIYYLNAGDNKATARVCDRLNPNLTFQPNFDASNVAKGIGFKPGTTGISYLTNLGTDTDKGQLTDASVTNCNLPSNAGTEVVAVDVGDATTPLLGSTGAGTPTGSYGYIRFKAVVK